MLLPPKGIYLETSVLKPLPLHIFNAEMEQLKKISKDFKIPVFIPEVALQEWIPFRKESVKKNIRKTDEGLNHLSKFFDYVEKASWGKNKDDIINDTESVTKKILKENNISIITTPDIDLRLLLEMSINKIRPFEEGNEKGFRDSIILFTVLNHARERKENPIFFIANDLAYKHEDVESISKKHDVELVVIPSISNAVSEFERSVESVMESYDKYQKIILIAFLKDNAADISKYLKENIELTPSFIYQNLDYDEKVVEIANIKVIDIKSVTRGTLPDGTSEGRVKISFVAITKFDVIVKGKPHFPEPKFKYGEKIPPRYGFSMASLLSDDQIKAKAFEAGISIEGSVTLEKDGNNRDRYSDLGMDNLVTD